MNLRLRVLRLGASAALAMALAACRDRPPASSAPRITVTPRTFRTLPPDGFTTSTAITLPPEATAPPATGPGGVTVPVTVPRTSPFCNLVRRYTDTAASLSSATPATLPQVLADLTSAIEQAAAVAPPQVKSDAAVVATTHRQFLDALRQANFDATQVPPEAATRLTSEPFVGARDRVRAFSQQSCG
ncbi:MAG: hypothetical protein ACRD1K_00720 [Acidimicrobiales bacterium]